jgi:hypothetical protein
MAPENRNTHPSKSMAYFCYICGRLKGEANKWFSVDPVRDKPRPSGRGGCQDMPMLQELANPGIVQKFEDARCRWPEPCWPAQGR